jgi:hypothetical protein
MKDKEKAAFLRAEGWFIGPGYDPWLKGFKVCRGTMIDPVKKHLYGHGLLDMCFQIAKRRKSQREARALRKAGWRRSGKGWIRPYTWSIPLTRSDALIVLSNRAKPVKRKGS